MKRTLLLRYGAAAVAVGLALLIKLSLDPFAGEHPFLLLAGAVLVGAWFGGFGPGLLATALATMVADYFFLPPVGSFTGAPSQIAPLILFALQGVLISSLVEALHSARKRAETSAQEARNHQETLRRSEERFRLVVDGVKDYAIFMLDPRGRVATWNEGAERVYGYPAEEVVGRHLSMFYVPEDVERAHAEEELSIAARERRHEEEGVRVRKDGSRFWASVLTTALRDEEDDLRGFSKIVRDITERKEAERALAESEERFRTLVQNSSDVITVIDAGGIVSYVSPSVERLMGYRPEELVGKGVYYYVRPDDLQRATDVFTEVWSRAGVHPPLEFDVPHKDGSWRRSEFIFNNLLDDPSVRGVVVNQRDITERKQAEEKLRESEELHRRVVEQAAENIFLVDAQTKHIIQANPALRRSLGYSTEELHELTLYEIVTDVPEKIDRNIRTIVEEGRRSLGERRYRRKDGSLIDVEVNAGALSYGGRPALCVVAHDVTERKRAEDALRRSLDALLALYEAGKLLSSSLEREEIGSRLLEIVRRVSKLTTAVISVPDEEGELGIWRSSGLEGLWRRARFAPEALSARRKVLETRRRQVVGLRRPRGVKRPALVGLYLPLLVRDRLIGVLEAYGSEDLVEEGMETLDSLASQAASALENARLYAELAERENQLHSLIGRLIVAQEEERRRVAYEVHDGLAQTAAAAHQYLQAFARHHPPGPDRAREELDECLQLVRQTVGEARQVIYDLRPTVLDDFGLAAAVRLQVGTLRAEGFEVDLEEALGDRRLPSEVETTLFRVAQEALTNVRKHAQASRVHVTLDRAGRTVRLEVKDQGRGFEPAEAAKMNGPGERVGLSGMRERVSLLGGSFELHSTPGTGTTITAEVELPASREDPDHAG